MPTYRVWVKGGRVVAGYAQDGARLNVTPGEYQAHWVLVARGQTPDFKAALRVLSADQRGGNLDVLREEFPEDLADFPNLGIESKFEIIETMP